MFDFTVTDNVNFTFNVLSLSLRVIIYNYYCFNNLNLCTRHNYIFIVSHLYIFGFNIFISVALFYFRWLSSRARTQFLRLESSATSRVPSDNHKSSRPFLLPTTVDCVSLVPNPRVTRRPRKTRCPENE